MKSAIPAPPDDHVGYALKAVISLLVQTGRLKLSDIFEAHPLFGDPKFNAQKVAGDFMRFNATPKYVQRYSSHFLTATQKAIDVHKIQVPAYMHALAAHAGLTIAGHRPDGIPPYIDAGQLNELAGGLEPTKPMIDRFAGCWNIYRLSTRRTNDVERFALGFLNIKPFLVLKQLGLPTPEFMYIQQGEDQGSQVQSKVLGAVVRSQNHIILLGARSDIFGRSITHPAHLSWKYVDSGHLGREKLISGLAAVPNSEGNTMVAGYFCARYIPDSDTLLDEDYDKFKDANTKHGLLGSVEWNALKKTLKDDPVLVEALQSIIDRSRADSIFLD